MVERIKTGLYTLVVKDDELEEEDIFLVKPKKKNHTEGLGGWTLAWQEESMNIGTNKSLKLTDHKVLRILEAKLDFENWIRISQQEIAEILGIAQPNICVSMKKLIEHGMVIPGPSVKKIKTFKLSPSIAWKGTMQQGAKERRKALTDLEATRRRKVLLKLKVIEGGLNKKVTEEMLDCELPF